MGLIPTYFLLLAFSFGCPVCHSWLGFLSRRLYGAGNVCVFLGADLEMPPRLALGWLQLHGPGRTTSPAVELSIATVLGLNAYYSPISAFPEESKC